MKFWFPLLRGMKAAALSSLLGPADPAPVEVVNAGLASPLLLVCEHAGRAIPAVLGDMGLTETQRASHIGWDIGAGDVARRLADRLSAPLILQRYSRLVIDANRPPDGPHAIPEVSDGVPIPANRGLTAADRAARARAVFDPLDRAIRARATPQVRAMFSIHSFTRVFGGADRTMHAGFLTRASLPTAATLMTSIGQADRSLRLALNEPYRIEDETDWFIPAHAEPRGLPHCLIEIRNDLIDHPAGADRWAGLLADAIRAVMKDLP